MSIEEIKNRFQKWNLELSKDEKKYIHYNSMNNFLSHYNELNERKKKVTLDLFTNYVNQIEKANFVIDKYTSVELATSLPGSCPHEPECGI
jgi:hypothetical protein